MQVRSIVAVVLGNALEFYDFTIYAVFASILSHSFFPTADPVIGLILSVSTFGVGFLVRPLGGVLIGAWSDRYGRKSAITITIGLMAFGTGIIGLLPTYGQIGIAAPLLLVFARLVQGFSAGGELGPSTIFLMETAPRGREGFFSAFQFAGQGMGAIISGAVGVVLAVLLPKAAVEGWGWRVPFAMGILIAPFGIYIRGRLGDAPEQVQTRKCMSSILSTLCVITGN